MFRDSVIYQIYPKSFADSNGDGVGDVRGIISKLDYLQYLGVDMLWLTPIFVSPQRDNGYDVADYYAIDEIYGTMDDVQELIDRASDLGIGIMFDMVFNHTSTNHGWFRQAMLGDSNCKDYYIFKKNIVEPTNWQSKFGGNAWEYVPHLGEWYLHLFDKTQADLNWANPKVRQELVQVVNFWMQKGVKGFRFDVINLISKDNFDSDDTDGKKFYTDRPLTHTYLKQLNAESFGKDRGCMTVGEMSSTTIANCAKYAGENEGELNMVFSFHHLKVDYKDGDKWSVKPFDFVQLKKLLFEWQVGMQQYKAWNALFWCNHDQPRAISRLGDDKNYHYLSATMLATVIHCMRGTPYIYQGEEIGMTNAYFGDIAQYRDVESINYYSILQAQGKQVSEIVDILSKRSRDNARTPMQWDDSQNAGFSRVAPWIQVVDNYKDINVSRQVSDPNSILEYYRNLIRLRKKYKLISHGSFAPLLVDHDRIISYERIYNGAKLLVICNFFGSSAKLDLDTSMYKCILNNYHSDSMDMSNVQPYQALVLISE